MNLGKYRERPVSRLEGLSDAVFALAATLLVVSLDTPRDFGALLGQLYGFGAFAITFAALITLWTIHNAFFRRYGLADGWTVLLNSVLLFVVLFYVYPLKYLTEGLFVGVLGVSGFTSPIADHRDLAILFMLYSAGFFAIFLTISLMYLHAWRARHALGLDALEAWEAKYLCGHYLLFALTAVLSVGIAYSGRGVAFGLPGLIYLVLGPACYLHGIWREKQKPAAGAESRP